MLTGRSDMLPELGSSKDLLSSGPASDLSEDEEAAASEQVVYTASFKELAAKYVLYETIIWVAISLLLVLAWGIGIIMLLYLPIKRYVLQKDISSRKLYITPTEIVYKVSRPSYIPFWGLVTIEKHIPLPQVIDIIIEQGCLQSVYGIHTFRVEYIAHGKAAPVDELQVQGVCNPRILRKIIVTEAAKMIQDVGRSWRPIGQIGEGESMVHIGSSYEGSAVLLSTSKTWKAADVLLHKIEEVNKSVKKIELLVEKSQAAFSST